MARRSPGLPIQFEQCSNGEYDPDPITPVRMEAEAVRSILGPVQFVFDVQGHLLEYDLDPSTRRLVLGEPVPPSQL